MRILLLFVLLVPLLLGNESETSTADGGLGESSFEWNTYPFDMEVYPDEGWVPQSEQPADIRLCYGISCSDSPSAGELVGDYCESCAGHSIDFLPGPENPSVAFGGGGVLPSYTTGGGDYRSSFGTSSSSYQDPFSYQPPQYTPYTPPSPSSSDSSFSTSSGFEAPEVVFSDPTINLQNSVSEMENRLDELQSRHDEAKEDLNRKIEDIESKAANLRGLVSKASTKTNQRLDWGREQAKIEYNGIVDTISNQFTKINQALEDFQEETSGSPSELKTDPSLEGYQKLVAADNYSSYVKSRLTDIETYKSERMALVSSADKGIQAADESFSKGDIYDGEVMLDASLTLLDVSISLTPVLGEGRDIYEAVEGRDLITGEELGVTARFVAAIGAGIGIAAVAFPAILPLDKVADSARALVKLSKVSGTISGNIDFLVSKTKRTIELAVGLGMSAKDLAGIIKYSKVSRVDPERVIRSATNIGFKNADDIKGNIGTIERWGKSFRSSKIDDSSTVNQLLKADGYTDPPYMAGTKVVSFISESSEQFVRVHGGFAPGRWVLKKSDIQGLSPAQIKEKFALPNTPTHISDVNVPVNTPMRMGTTGPNYGHPGGSTQFEITQRIPEESYGPGSIIDGVVQ